MLEQHGGGQFRGGADVEEYHGIGLGRQQRGERRLAYPRRPPQAQRRRGDHGAAHAGRDERVRPPLGDRRDAGPHGRVVPHRPAGRVGHADRDRYRLDGAPAGTRDEDLVRHFRWPDEVELDFGVGV